MTKHKLLLGMAAAMAASALAVPSASAAPTGSGASPHGASLHGRVGLSPERGTVPGFGELTLAVDAAAGRRRDGTGRATLQHEFFNPDGSWQGTVRAEIDVDCLAVTGSGSGSGGGGGTTAAVTGTVRSLSYAVPPETPEPPRPPSGWHPETALAFSTDGTGRGRGGWSGVPDFNDPTAAPVAVKCAAPAADFYVIEGGYRLRR
ncbi:hypothetical protein GCM10009759_78100 [Kitasatospora saccharophila]|uniref:Uncharacterized protein n=1 Tax=Kitasatospora saccharophila TaxID=407973 RepID=A0ABP5K1P5_9ACTN